MLAACALVGAGCGDDPDESPAGRVAAQNGESPNEGGGGYYYRGGGSDEEESGDDGAGTDLMLSAHPSGALEFDQTALSAKTGKVTTPTPAWRAP